VFSDERVALAFNAKFISVWENQRPESRFLDNPPKPEKVLFQPWEDLPLGQGDTNVISVFATPEGQILNAVPGYLDAEAFLDEMRLAQAVRKLTLDDNYQPLPGASKAFAGLHRAASDLYGNEPPARAHWVLETKGMGTLMFAHRFSHLESPAQTLHGLFAPPSCFSFCSE